MINTYVIVHSTNDCSSSPGSFVLPYKRLKFFFLISVKYDGTLMGVALNLWTAFSNTATFSSLP